MDRIYALARKRSVINYWVEELQYMEALLKLLPSEEAGRLIAESEQIRGFCNDRAISPWRMYERVCGPLDAPP